MTLRQILFLIILFLYSGQIIAQEKPVSFKGNIGVYGDFYQINSTANTPMAARRPPFNGRLVLNATLTIKKLSIPITVLLFNKQFSTLYPSIPNENIFEYISNPGNSVGIAPKYKWIELQLGTHVPKFSELSVGDLPVFGIGLNLSPGKFRFSVFKGNSLQAIKPDSLKNSAGQFKQTMLAAKIGFGKEESTHLYFIGALITDDTNSIGRNTGNLVPKKGVVSSVDYRLNMGKKLWVKGEVAASAFTRDLGSKKFDSMDLPIDIPPQIFVVQESSRLDYASVLTIGKEGKNLGFQIQAKYIGDGFSAVGYPFLQTDRMDITLNPRLSLANGKFNLNGCIGKRVNNLSGNRSSESTQILGMANLQVNFSERFNVSANYSNFGFSNTITNDTFKINMVTQSIGFNPIYMIHGKSAQHFISLSINQDEFRDYNVLSGVTNNNDVLSWMFNYNLSFSKTPFKFGFLLNQLNNQMYVGNMRMNSANINFGYTFFKKKLLSQIGFTYTESSINHKSPSVQLLSNLMLRYSFTKKTSFSVAGNINNFNYGDMQPGVSFIENFVKTSLTHQF